MNIKNLIVDGANKIAEFTKENQTQIMTGTGIGLVLGGTVLAVVATTKAVKAIEARKKELAVYDEEEGVKVVPEKLSVKEVIKTAGKYYIPSAVTTALGVFSIVKSDSISNKKEAALVAVCKASETAFKELDAKVKEVVGEEKAKEIKDKIAEDRMERADKNMIVSTGHGDQLCFDYWSGRYFYSDPAFLRKCVLDMNARMLRDGIDGSVSLNDFYYEIGLPPTGAGEQLGWRTEWGTFDLGYESQTLDDRRTAYVMSFNNMPQYGYDKYNY